MKNTRYQPAHLENEDVNARPPHGQEMQGSGRRSLLLISAAILLLIATACFLFFTKTDAGKIFGAAKEGGAASISVSEHPSNVIAKKGEPAVFSAAANGNKCSYQWQTRSNSWDDWVNSSCEGSQTPQLCVDTNSLEVSLGNYYYRCLITDRAGNTVSSDTATLIVWTFDEGTKTLTILGRGKMPDWDWDGSDAPWHRETQNASTIMIQDGIENIGSYAFWDTAAYSSQATIFIPRTVNSISLHALEGRIKDFEVNRDNPVYCSIDGALFDKSGSTLLRVPGGREGRYIVPEGTSVISGWAFEWCAYIEQIEFPDGITAIGDHVFNNCKALHKLLLPDGLLTIGNHIFSGETMYMFRPLIAIPASVESIGENHYRRLTNWQPMEIYYSGTEKDWQHIAFSDPEDAVGDYTIYFLSDDPENASMNNPWFDYAGRWVSGQQIEETNYYEEEITIRFTGNDSLIFSWIKPDAAELIDLHTALDPNTGIAIFDDKLFFTWNEGRGTIIFHDGSVTLHLESSQRNGSAPDGYEVTFNTKESDHLQSARWFS